MGSVQKILRHPHSHKKAATKPTLRIQHTRPENPLPLCVDLDGSLLRSDILIESILILFKRAPLDAFSLIFSLSLGKAHFKQEVARRACPDVRFLPYNLELLKFLKTEKASGRRILLVTGAHRLHAEAVAQHLQLFDAIIATDQNVNCVGPTKLKLIEGRLGPKNFIYVGNSADDLYVWQGAAEAITADLRASLLADLAKICTIQKEIKSSPPSWLHILRALRVHHWAKSLLVFAPPLFAHRLHDLDLLKSTFFAFIAFSLASSSVYILNDLFDLESDRTHLSKRKRPWAAGILHPTAGFSMAAALIALSCGISLLLDKSLLLLIVSYHATSVVYSLKLKEIPILDVIVLSLFYMSRVFAGSLVSHCYVSEWLLAFLSSLFLSLALLKRYSEINRISRHKTVKGRDYLGQDSQVVLSLGVSTGVCAILVLLLYLNSSQAQSLYRHPEWLGLACPLCFYWVGKVWMLQNRDESIEDPVTFILRDPVSQIIGLAIVLILWVAT